MKTKIKDFNQDLLVLQKSSIKDYLSKIVNNERKLNRKYYKHNISLENAIERFNYFPVSNYKVTEEIINEEELLKLIKDNLTIKQQIVLINHFYLGKSLRQIAKETKRHHSTVEEICHASIKKLKKVSYIYITKRK